MTFGGGRAVEAEADTTKVGVAGNVGTLKTVAVSPTLLVSGKQIDRTMQI